jgi:hypothetical protein
MKLFLPNARATNWLLIVGFCSIGLRSTRYLAVEQSTIGLACQAGLNNKHVSRQVTIVCSYSVSDGSR